MIKPGTLNGTPVAVLQLKRKPSVRELEQARLDYDRKYSAALPLAISWEDVMRLPYKTLAMFMSRVAYFHRKTDRLVF